MAVGQNQPAVINGAVINGQGIKTALDITTATLVDTMGGRIGKVSVLVAGSAPGSVNDSATVGGVATSNQIAVIPNTVGIYNIDMPTFHGLVITPGTGQSVSVSYN